MNYMLNRKQKYLTFLPNEVFLYYNKNAVFFRAKCGSPNQPNKDFLLNQIRKTKYIERHLDTVMDSGNSQRIIRPNSQKGLSFSTDPNRFTELKLTGRIYYVDDLVDFPSGLEFNIKDGDYDHPLLNVSRKMVYQYKQGDEWVYGEFLDKMIALQRKLKPTDLAVKIKRDSSYIEELEPGALDRWADRLKAQNG